MNRVVDALLSRLTYGQEENIPKDDVSHGVIEALARVYEKARNALEYRADHLVRRAAIERILKRKILLNKNPKTLAYDLLRELRWARYLSVGERDVIRIEELEEVLKKYVDNIEGEVPFEWVIKIASAEVEELFNLNVDYREFTFFAFQTIKQKVALKDENLDLLIYFSVDKVYAESDDEQIAYHILKLGGKEFDQNRFEEAWGLFDIARKHSLLPKISKFVRRQAPSLILLRDIYFYDPKDFKNILGNKDEFGEKAEEVLNHQLSQMSDRIARAGFRSIVYVFLTKMVVGIGVEIPMEIFIYGKLAKLPLIINLLFPSFLMWMATSQIRLPREEERQALIERTWFVVNNFDSLKNESDVLVANSDEKLGLGYFIFSGIYVVIFFVTFGLIFFILTKMRFTFASQIIFVFFLTIIAFFAFRISQIAKIYSWKTSEGSSLFDTISLPILSLGSKLSAGLTKLNFLAFAFDFILEAPFKLVLGFLDSWVQFLSLKKEEEIVE